jgi:hypothetical protein
MRKLEWALHNSNPLSIRYLYARVWALNALDLNQNAIIGCEYGASRQLRSTGAPFEVAIPLPRSNGHGRRHSAGIPSRRKRESARVLGYPDRAPFPQ